VIPYNCSIRFTVHLECDIVQVNNKYQLNTIFRLHFIFHDKREKNKKNLQCIGREINALGLNINGGREREIQKTKNHSLKMFCTLCLC